MVVIILTTHWSEDYWNKSGVAPYTRYLGDMLNLVGDKIHRAIGIYKSGMTKGEFVDRTNLFPTFLKVTSIKGNEERITIEYKFYGDVLELPSKFVLEEIHKLPRYKKETFIPLCFSITDEEWRAIQQKLQITNVPSWWKNIDQISQPEAETKKITPEDFRSKYSTGAYRAKYGFMVRSRIEMIIADFLMDNGIVVQYEPSIFLDDIEIHPDFYIPSLDVYIEYWGSDKPEYLEKREIKEKLYQKYGVEYISLEEKDANFIHDKLKQKLSKYIPGKTDWK